MQGKESFRWEEQRIQDYIDFFFIGFFFFLQGLNGNCSQTLSTVILQTTSLVKSVTFIYLSTVIFEEGKPQMISCKD